jgi:hypothetical protein
MVFRSGVEPKAAEEIEPIAAPAPSKQSRASFGTV